ncbi:MAG: hypothetical protein F6J96_36320 [Symploca sp. SIO1C2]|nr:hypothetical protein [Symploca sp. SIO1C2]NER49863.1 hypothetical protein [Symploca sp. SIO1A3]
MQQPVSNQSHSTGWVVQAWTSFIISIAALTIGIIHLPVDSWVKGYMGMGLAFTVGSTINVSKTTRDLHESKRLTSRLDEARVEKILNEHHPLK